MSECGVYMSVYYIIINYNYYNYHMNYLFVVIVTDSPVFGVTAIIGEQIEQFCQITLGGGSPR